MRMLGGIVLLVLVHGIAGCGGSGPVAPSPIDGSLIKGAVYDTANRPIAGAIVKVLDGPQAGTSATADAMGGFTLTGTFDDTTRFRATSEGHVGATKTLNPSCAACNPHRWVFFSLDVLAPPVNIAGDYTLTFIADSACAAALPPEVRTREYAATITPMASSNTTFNLELSGASLLQRTFWIGVAGDYLSLWFGDPSLVEQLATNTYLEVGGEATASVGTSGVSAISASFSGEFDYCARKSEMGRFYDCRTSQAVVAHARCESKNHQLILTRR